MKDSDRFMVWYFREHARKLVDLDHLIGMSIGTTPDEVMAEVNVKIQEASEKKKLTLIA